MHRRATAVAGFTLIELMVVIAVVAILAAIAYPSFRDTIRSNRVAAVNNELLAAIALARSEAIRNHFGAGLCAANAAADGCGTGADLATNGWLVWADTSAAPGFDAKTDTVLRVSQSLPQMVMETDAATAGSIRFDQRGRLNLASGGASARITFQPAECPAGAQRMQRTMTLNSSGQAVSVAGACP